MQGPTLLGRTFLSAKLRKQFTCKWVCHFVWTQRIILKSCCERTNFQISACASQSGFSVLWQTAFIRGISWTVFIVLVSMKHPFCTVDVYAGDSVGEKMAWRYSSPASEITCPNVPPPDNEQTDNCGSQGKKARAATTVLSQSHPPTVAMGCSCTMLARGACSRAGPSPRCWLLFLVSRC